MSIAVALPGRLHAEGDPIAPRLRVVDPQMRGVLQPGRDLSPSFRALVERLDETDVVVYVHCGRLPSGLHGQLTFLSAAGGNRYVVVQIARGISEAEKIAMLGQS